MENWLENIFLGIIFIGICYLAVRFFILAILEWFGYTSSGIASGSCAASIHSMIGDVPVGSIFATLQSTAMSGFSRKTTFTVCGAICGVSGCFFCSHFWKCIAAGTVLGYMMGRKFA